MREANNRGRRGAGCEITWASILEPPHEIGGGKLDVFINGRDIEN